MSYIAWFKELNKNSITTAGGKGANLGEMYNLSLPIPPGFVVTAQTYQQFTERTKIKDKILDQLKCLNIEETDQLQKVAQEIQNIINSTKVPEDITEEIINCYGLLGSDKKAEDFVDSKDVFVAVRSSATAEDLPSASFAGQQATFLNVKGKDQIVPAVRACWASLFTARAIYYRERNHFPHDKVFIAVVVQRMVNSEKSGIMFTINPVTNQEDEIVIEAVYGLGEAIVGGEISPDTYILDKNTKAVKSMMVKKKEWGLFRNSQGNNVKLDIPKEKQERQVVPDSEIKELARLGKRIEEHYGSPQDIEWAIEKSQVMIVQARAVTTFHQAETAAPISTEVSSPKTIEREEEEEAGKILLKGETASRGVYSGPVKVVREISELNKIQKGDVLVTKMTTPDMVPAMQKAGAIITDEGGMTCHAAIVSREMGTPCLVGTEIATKILTDGQIVTVHATRGIVYDGKIKFKETKPVSTALTFHGEPGARDLLTATEIKVIMDLPDLAEKTASTGADGVGLVRLEIMIANGGIHPAEYIRQNKDQDYRNLLKNGIRKIAQAFAHKPVWVRCSDMRSDEYRNLRGGDQEPKETDPMIGWHAIRRLLDQPRILKAEFQAIKELHDEGLTNVGVMIPFVIRTEEVKKAKQIMRDLGLEPVQEIDFGVMI